MSLPGKLEPADDGVTTTGNWANMESAFPVLFRDAGLTDAEDLGFPLPNSSDVVCKTDNLCDYFPNHGSGPGLKFTDFAGTQAMGDWSFCVGDSAGGDTGTITAVTLTLFLQ
jgi:hypothetical protein